MQQIIFIPGLGSDAAVWARTIDALGSDAVSSVGDTLRDDTLGGMAARILDAAPERFVLAGSSMGGMVAMEIMRTAPARVAGLALIGTNARPDTEAQAAYRRSANAALQANADLRSLVQASLDRFLHPSAGKDIREELVEMGVRIGAETYIRQNEAVAKRADYRSVLSSIKVPTLIAVGEQDQVTPPEQAEEIGAAIPESRLHILAECGHLPSIEKPEETAGLLKDLLFRARR